MFGRIVGERMAGPDWTGWFLVVRKRCGRWSSLRSPLEKKRIMFPQKYRDSTPTLMGKSISQMPLVVWQTVVGGRNEDGTPHFS